MEYFSDLNNINDTYGKGKEIGDGAGEMCHCTYMKLISCCCILGQGLTLQRGGS